MFIKNSAARILALFPVNRKRLVMREPASWCGLGLFIVALRSEDGVAWDL